MRIDPFQRRRGSLSVEAVMVIPVALVVILLARYVHEGMLTRHEIGVYTRGAAINHAIYGGPSLATCQHDSDGLTDGAAGVNRTGGADCNKVNGENGLRSSSRIFRALDDGASGWPAMARQISRNVRIYDIAAEGSGSMRFDQPPFFAQATPGQTTAKYIEPEDELWFHDDKRQWKVGHDPVIWRDLPSTTRRLFPRLFPSRRG